MYVFILRKVSVSETQAIKRFIFTRKLDPSFLFLGKGSKQNRIKIFSKRKETTAVIFLALNKIHKNRAIIENIEDNIRPISVKTQITTNTCMNKLRQIINIYFLPIAH